MVVDHHAELGLAVLIVDGHVEMGREPADHFGVQRFTGAAHGAQLALHTGGGLRARGDQQAVGGRRACEVGDAVGFNDAIGALDGERAVVKGGGVAEQKRAGHRVIQAVGPAGIGDVPEPVLRP